MVTTTEAAPAVELKLKLHRLHAGQLRISAARKSARFVVGVLGRRVGKTYYGLDSLLNRALEVGRNYRAMWVAPTHDLASIAMQEWRERIPAQVCQMNRSTRTATIVSGAQVIFRSAENPDSLIGRGFDDVVVDEGSRISSDAIKRAILPTLADRGGRLLALTSPRGKKNWVYEYYLRGLDEAQAEWRSVHGPSLDNPNPYIREWCHQMAPPELGGEGGMPEEIYRQEILAEFLEDAAQVFRNVRGCVNSDLKLLPWSEGRPTIIGADVAKRQDFTVLTGMREVGGKRRVVCWDRFHRIAWPLQVARIAAAARESGGAMVVVDATGVGDVVFDDLLATGTQTYPYKFTNLSKQQLVEGARGDLEHGIVEYPDVPQLVSELEAYSYEITKLGQFTYSAPDGTHDDAAVSLCLANWGMKTRSLPLVSFG